MTGWIQVDRSRYKSLGAITGGTDSVATYVSPYDIPEAMRVYYERSQNEVVIEFWWPGSEPSVKKEVMPGVVCELGANSSRLFKLVFSTVDQEDHALHSAVLELAVALDSLKKLEDQLRKGKLGKQVNHLDVTSRILKDKWPEFEPSLALA